MSELKNQNIERYLDRIQDELCKLVPTDDFISSLRSQLYDYLEYNPNCTLEDLENEFGAPSDIARDYLQDNDALSPHNVVRAKKRRNIIIAILLVAIIICGGILIDILSHEQTMATDVVYIED